MDKLELRFLSNAILSDLYKLLDTLNKFDDIKSDIYIDELEAISKCTNVIAKIAEKCS